MKASVPQEEPSTASLPSQQQAALDSLVAIEHAAKFIASDTAQLLGGLQAGLQSVRNAHATFLCGCETVNCTLNPAC